MREIDPKQFPVSDIHKILVGGIAPRPIAFVSTLSKDGIPNLAPFSFYSLVGYNPPIVCFSPSRRASDGKLKDTYFNLLETKECVIQAVTYGMVEQVSLSSSYYAADVDEFLKSGFTPIASKTVAVPRVKESPFQMECKLLQMIPLGEKGGAGNLAICEVTYIHVAEEILSRGAIDPYKIDLVARLGDDLYTRVSGSTIFEVEKPFNQNGIGFDGLPDFMKTSTIYTGNDLARFACVEKRYTAEQASEFLLQITAKKNDDSESSYEKFAAYKQSGDYKNMLLCLLGLSIENAEKHKLVELAALTAMRKGDIDFAWKTALLVALI